MSMKPILSILICTIEGRENYLERLIKNITKQIFDNNLEIEVIVEKDKRGENTIGKKRNTLLSKSSGNWACFIDDDDIISETYLKKSMEILKTQNPDCINLIGQITYDGENPEIFKHELKHKRWFTENNIHYRPPNHLNIIRTDISKLFQFPEINHGEDTQWSLNLSNSNLLKTEGVNDEIVYFYEYLRNKK